jgi:hypothetical protein
MRRAELLAAYPAKAYCCEGPVEADDTPFVHRGLSRDKCHHLGDRHPVTALVALGCLVASFFMMRHLIQIKTWGYSIRYAIATVVVFWTAVEVFGRWNLFRQIWLYPVKYRVAMLVILLLFVALLILLTRLSTHKKINNK